MNNVACPLYGVFNPCDSLSHGSYCMECDLTQKAKPFELRDYQEQGVRFFNNKKRALNRDKPGLGKTAQAAFAADGKYPVLVSCPNYLVEQWFDWLTGQDEKSIERNSGYVVPNVKGSVQLCTGTWNQKFTSIRGKANWTIINQEMLVTHGEILKDRNYRTIIFDEVHHLRNRNAKRSKLAVAIAKKAEYVFELSATPIYREVDDLYNQLRILQPEIFTSYWQFVDKFCIAETGYFGTQVLGVKKEMIPELETLLDIVSIGRDYNTAGRELPPIIEKYVKIELPPQVRKLYNQAISEYQIEVLEEKFTNYMAIMHILRKIVTGHFKIQAVQDLLSDEVRKAVIFSWYQDTANEIATTFGDMEVVTGQDKVSVRRSKALGDKHVSATIASLSEGIDLSDARTVIFAEENWTPGSNFQALSRIVRERVGGDNTQPVIVYYVHCKDTIDEVIHRRSKTREGTIREVIREALYLD